MMELDGQIVEIRSYEHQKIGRGSAQVRLKVKNIRTGAIFDTTAQAGAKWPRIRLDQRMVQYLYSEGDVHYFMDKKSYEQFPLSPTQLGDAVNYLKDGMELEVAIGATRLSLRRPAVIAANTTAAEASATEPRSLAITSPLVGIFHASVSAGDDVHPGQSIGAVEALGMPTSVEAPQTGTVEE